MFHIGFAAGGVIVDAARSDFMRSFEQAVGSHSSRGCGLEPVDAVGQHHQVNHCSKQEQEDALRDKHATGIKDEPDLVELCHVSILP
jgi:hypothetical protein